MLLAALPALASEEHGGGHGGGHGLEIFPTVSELLPLMVLFILLIPIVNAVLFKPIFSVLDARDERIDGARRRSANLERDAAAVIERYRSAVAEVRAEAEVERRATLDAARRAHEERVTAERKQAEGLLDTARGELASSLESARHVLQQDVELLAREAAARILGRPLS